MQITKSPSLGPVLNRATLSIDENKGLLIVVSDPIDKEMLDSEKHQKVILDTMARMINKSSDRSVCVILIKIKRI